jgi:hypothetical protein
LYVIISFDICCVAGIKRTRSYSGDTARAARRSFMNAAKNCNSNPALVPSPLSVAKSTSGGASKTTIYRWMNTDMSEKAMNSRLSHRGRKALLSDDMEALVIGFVVDRRLNLLAVHRDDILDFALSFLHKKLQPQYISNLLKKYHITLQTTLPRQGRMIDLEVVDDATQLITELRNEEWKPDEIIVMDETGAWSNTVQKNTYHFINWYS